MHSVDLQLGLNRLGRLENYAATPEALADDGASLLYLDVGLSENRMNVAWLRAWDTVHAGNVRLEKLAGVDREAELLRAQPSQPLP